MRSTFSLLLLAALALLSPSRAAAPEVIAAGEWSKPVADNRGTALRGRLVLGEKVVGPERREVAVYVELQDASEAIGSPIRVFCDLGRHDFRPEYRNGLHCELRDKHGKPVRSEPIAFGGAVPLSEWVSLPPDATIRLRSSPFGIHRPGARAICPHLDVLWVIPDNDPDEYQLRGTFTVIPPTEDPPVDARSWRGTLELPPLRVTGRRTLPRLAGR